MTAFRNRDAVLRTRSARARRGVTALALLLHRATPPRLDAREQRETPDIGRDKDGPRSETVSPAGARDT